MSKIFTVIFISSFIIFGCSNPDSIRQFQLSHEIVDLNPHYYKKGYQFDISNDTLIILDGYSFDTLFHVYNLRDNKLIGKFGSVGDAPFEVSRPGSFYWSKDHDKVVIADHASLNLKEYELSKALVNDEYRPRKIAHPQNIGVGFFQNLNDSVFVTRQMDQTDDLLITFNQNEVLDTLGKWYNNDDPIVLFDEFQQYYYVNNKHPNENKFVASYFSYDIIQIVDAGKGESIIVRGPDKISYTDNPEEFLAYRWPATAEQYIYASYIGAFAGGAPEAISYPKEIHVISWEGEHVAELKLDVPVRYIQVDEKEGLIYALADDEEGNFVKFKIPNL